MIDGAFIYEIRHLAGIQRDDSFARACEVANALRIKNIVETGTYRGIQFDGQSTRILSMLARELGASFASIDIFPRYLKEAAEAVKDIGIATFHEGDSVDVLSRWKDPIGFLYLDSFDYDVMNHLPSQLHQLAEIGAAMGKLEKDCMILLDDSLLKGGGKCALSAQLLRQRGFKLDYDSYQQLWIR